MSRRFSYRSIPVILTVITFFFLCALLFFFLNLLSLFPLREPIKIIVIPVDIVIGMTIYFKTSLDFALFMGSLMHSNPGWEKRIAIELGTAIGNGLGTLVVLLIWIGFKQIPLLMVGMIFIASLILLQMAEEGLERSLTTPSLKQIKLIISSFYFPITYINHIFKPLIAAIIPAHGITKAYPRSFYHLFLFSLTIPFFLGLDDFAGYIPLFTVVNVFSFIMGVFLAHMFLNIALFAFPKKTVTITKQPVIVMLGSILFVILAAIGFLDIIHIILHVI